jgi:predicted transcriptional regulator of viral defense system
MEELDMIMTILDLREKYKDYSDLLGKINREVKKGNLITVVKGLYETDKTTPGYLLTSYIYGPSYLSFEYALSYHGLIPEKVVNYTCATFGKNKSKKYSNIFGNYTYRDVPKTAYPYGIEVYIHERYSYFVATKEKSICDILFIKESQTSMKRLKSLLFDDLRIDMEEFYKLDKDELLFLCSLYRSKNIKLLKKIIEKELK